MNIDAECISAETGSAPTLIYLLRLILRIHFVRIKLFEDLTFQIRLKIPKFLVEKKTLLTQYHVEDL